jgi:hypothetical protein
MPTEAIFLRLSSFVFCLCKIVRSVILLAVRSVFMSSKTKAFIGITVSLVILIVLFASTGGYRAARAAKQAEDTCALAEKGSERDTIAQGETK